MKLLLFCLFTIIGSCTNSFAQDQRFTDSLELTIGDEKNHDTIRINGLLQLALVYYPHQIDSVISIYERAENLALTSMENENDSQSRLILASKLRIIYSDFGEIYISNGVSDKALHYYNKALREGEKNGDQLFVASCFNNIGFIFYRLGETDSALIYFHSAYDRFVEIRDTLNAATALSSIANCHYLKGDFETSLNIHDQIIRLSESINDTAGMAYSYATIARLYRDQKEYGLAKKSSEKALKLGELSGNFELIGMAHLNLGFIQQLRGHLDSALYFNYKCLEAYQLSGIQLGEAEAMLNIGEVYKLQGKMEESLSSFQESLSINREFGSLSGIADACTEIAKLKYEVQEYDVAWSMADEAFDAAEQLGAPRSLMKAAEIRYKVAQKLQNWEAAFQNHDLYVLLRDSLNNSENEKLVIRQALTFEHDKADAIRDAEYKKDLEIKEEQRKAQTYVIYSVIAGAVLLGIFLSFVFVRLKKERRQKEIIEKQNNEKSILLKEIHHRVKNNLQVISSLLNLQSRTIVDDSALSAVKEGQNRVKSIALIHQKLYQTEDLSEVALEEYVQQLSTFLKSVFGKSDCQVNINITPSDLTLDTDTAVPVGLILNELITNSLKYGCNEHKRIDINLNLQTPGSYVLIVSDHGPGLPLDLDISKARSLGLRLVRELSKQLQGEFQYTKDPLPSFKVIFKATNVRRRTL